MQAKMDKQEHGEVHVEVQIERGEFEEGLQYAYRQVVKKVNIPGFRKGKVPRLVLEAQLGEDVLYEDAINHLLPDVFRQAVEDLDLKPISSPSYDQLDEIKKGEPVTVGFTVAVKPEVKLGILEGLEIAVPKLTVEEEQVDQLVGEMQNRYAETYIKEDEPASEGDSLTIDFEGFVDGVAFEGGKAENYPLVLGSNSFIPGFETQLIGTQTGEEKDVDVIFPENYHATELAGKPAVFKVKIQQIVARKMRELNDEFAQEVSEYDTMEELRAGVRKDIEESNERQNRKAVEAALKDKLIEICEMELSDKVVEQEAYQMAEDFDRQLQQQNFSLDRYLTMTGSNPQKFLDEIRPQAEIQVKSQFILEKISEEKGFELTDEEIDNELQKFVAQYDMPIKDAKKILGEDLTSLKYDLMNKKAMDYVVDHAIIKELTSKTPEEIEEILEGNTKSEDKQEDTK